ncbi:hypothetical protein F4820DRAFT_258460 [Hypoxylon rubiginosum]|uniref:Uncharacterized protein n=1 Tax=Hypoxylon rubiginosum TaxID=110542 RepID=A0ACB9ZGJ3_9PEZI|nr:hypothetical protein F4820DRAFT_258460 [Hypoxylon rubiginosum]
MAGTWYLSISGSFCFATPFLYSDRQVSASGYPYGTWECNLRKPSFKQFHLYYGEQSVQHLCFMHTNYSDISPFIFTAFRRRLVSTGKTLARPSEDLPAAKRTCTKRRVLGRLDWAAHTSK